MESWDWAELKMRIFLCLGKWILQKLMKLNKVRFLNNLIRICKIFKIQFLVACGENYTVAITNDGQVYSCGNNDYGQLGHEKARKRLREYIF